jgi:hypothetical protein
MPISTKRELFDALGGLDPQPVGDFAILDDHEHTRPWVVVCDDNLVVATTAQAALDEVKRVRKAKKDAGGGTSEPGDGNQAGS